MFIRAALGYALFLSIAGCSSPPSLQSCASDADCGPGSACIGGSCGGNEPPTVAFTPPADATTHRLLSFQPTASDPEGRPVTLQWNLRAVAASCDPEPEPSEGQALDVVFWCPGTYEATVVPIDDAGVHGAPVTRAFDVVAATGAPTVSVGGALSVHHACALDVPECLVPAPSDPTELRLSASGTHPGGELTYEWAAFPPEDVAGDPALEVAFTPGSQVVSPTASIRNAGGPIAGVYRFRVRVRTADGLLAQAFQEVVVENRPPTAAPGSLLLPHRYVDGLYVAEGDVDTTATDPDGDPLLAAGALSPAPPTGCVEEVSPGLGGRVHVRIACSLAGGLIRESPRTLSVAVGDANGGVTTFTAPLVIENRPPVLALGADFGGAGYVLEHGVEPCRLATGPSCFVAGSGDPFVATDPDGDPLEGYLLGATTSAWQTASYAIVSVAPNGNQLRFETPVGLPSEFRAPDGSSGFRASATVSDSLGGTAVLAVPLEIGNRPPTVREPIPTAAVNHAYDAATRRYRASVPAATFEDPDGDPIAVSVASGGFCSRASVDGGRATLDCQHLWDYSLGGRPPFSVTGFSGTADVVADDGWESVGSPTAVTILDRPAVLQAPITTVENCACVPFGMTNIYRPSNVDIPLPLELVDPDGDPAQITVRALGSGASPQTVATVLPGWSTQVFSSPSASASIYLTSTPDDPLLALQVTLNVTCGLTGSCF